VAPLRRFIRLTPLGAADAAIALAGAALPHLAIEALKARPGAR